ncbi:MAG: phytanoyl-CoA dioxygenase family protein [Pseudomonadales bacterium]
MNRSALIKDPVACYKEHGFAILVAYPESHKNITDYATTWLNTLLGLNLGATDLKQYHHWFETQDIHHNALFSAKNRHRLPEPKLSNMLLNSAVQQFLKKIIPQDYDLWDDGDGWLAFRFIRPAYHDGYPFSCKAWGPAKNVISAWLPIIGFDAHCTLKMLPGSHIKTFAHHLPTESKFCKEEFRLCNEPTTLEIYQPELEPGDIIFFHPKLIHSEDVSTGDTTRFSLEFRLLPKAGI